MKKVTFLNDPCIHNTMNKQLLRLTLILGLLVIPVISALAQKPEVRALNVVQGAMEDVVQIQGSSFGTDASKIVVSFGAMRAQISTITNTLLEVQVPHGTTYSSVSVTNLTNGLTGYSEKQFLLSFSGKAPFDPTQLSAQQDFDAAKGVYDVCLCDLDNDNRVDAIAANDENNSLTILRNTSTGPGVVSFASTPFPLGAPSLHLKCGDLNGDGRKDLVVIDGTDGSDRIFILQNTGAFTFSIIPIFVTGKKNVKPEIADLDLDGKPEVILSSSGTNTLTVLHNTSSLATISFASSQVSLTIPGITSTDGIAAGDLNGDQRPELVTSQLNKTPLSNVFVFENTSSPGNITFKNPIVLSTSSVKNIQLGDLDGDAKTDIAVTGVFTGKVAIFRNTSSGSSVTFANEILFDVGVMLNGPWGIDFGDLNGDGKPDIALARNAENLIDILDNNSTPGTFIFSKSTITTNFKNRHIKVGDVDGDGKPDIVFNDDKNPMPKVSVLRNKHCVFPVLTPIQTPLTLCNNADRLPYKLRAPMSKGSFYEWSKDGIVQTCALNQNTFDVTAATGSGNYTVKILQEGNTCAVDAGGCELISDPIQVTIGSAVTVTNPNPTSNGPICIGSALQLSCTAVAGATDYKWSGPEGYSGTGISPAQITDFELNNAGTYQVDVYAGTCLARTATVRVEAIDVPTFQIGITGSNIICFEGGDKTLTVVPAPVGPTYQWFKNENLVGAGTSFIVTDELASSGTYKAKVTYAGCDIVETPAKEITVVNLPTPTFVVNPSLEACANQQIKFENQSTYDTSIPVEFSWTFGDGNTSTEESPTHIYVAAGTFTYTLKIAYEGNTCAVTSTGVDIQIKPAPAVSIINPNNTYEFCDGQTLPLQVNGTFTDYLWSTGATTQAIEATEGGNYSVTVTASGCPLTAIRSITMKPAPVILASANPQQINEGETAQLSASGVNNFSWSPVALVDNAASANPIAGPLSQTTTFTVTGSDGVCPGTATVVVTVIGEAIVNKLNPGSFFSPDNQGTPESEFWQVENILDYPQCGVTIYDDKGVKVFDSQSYQNDWDGTFNGKKLPDGVYFYIIRCEGEEATPKTGSITLLRK